MADIPTDPPTGLRFRLAYRGDGPLLTDSPRMRRRLAAIVDRLSMAGFMAFVEEELGVSIGLSYRAFCEKAELSDVLDLPSVLYRHLTRQFERAHGYEQRPIFSRMNELLETTERIFREERVAYRVDEKCGVRFAVDEAFEAGNVATIQGLGSKRYENVRDRFESALRDLSQATPDGKQAIRNVFSAAEGLFCLMFPEENQLKNDNVRSRLTPLVNTRFAGDDRPRVAAAKIVGTISEWIPACHAYRHEEGKEEPAQPPLMVAITLVAQGAAIIRWMVDLDPAATRTGL